MRRVYKYHTALFVVSYAFFMGLSLWNGEAAKHGLTAQSGGAILRKAASIASHPTSLLAKSGIGNPSRVAAAHNASNAGYTAARVPSNAGRVDSAPAGPIEPLPTPTLVVDHSSPAAQFRSLESGSQFDDRPENRLAAVQQLYSLAANGDADGSVLEALRIAATDADPRVAGAAAAAYQEVSQWDATRRPPSHDD